MVSASASHAGGPNSTLGYGRHGIFGVKTWLSTLWTVYHRVSASYVNVGPVSEPLRTSITGRFRVDVLNKN